MRRKGKTKDEEEDDDEEDKRERWRQGLAGSMPGNDRKAGLAVPKK